jgi:transcriptional regulator with XRE-family HTH domain
MDGMGHDFTEEELAAASTLRAQGNDVGALVMILRSRGLTQAEVGRRLGLSQPRVSGIEARMRGILPKTDLDALRADMVAQLDRVRARAEGIMNEPGAPVVKTVSVGEGVSRLVYVREPGGEEGEPGEVVRDYAVQLAAMREVVRAQARESALLGTDAATKVEQSGGVRVEIVGVDLDAMK